MKIFDALMAIGFVVMMVLAGYRLWMWLFPPRVSFATQDPADLFDEDGNLKNKP